MTRFYLMAGGRLTKEHYETRSHTTGVLEAERVVERINRGLERIGSTLRYRVVELVR